MATPSCCQLCEGHMKEWEIAQKTLSLLRSKVDELHMRENEAIKQAQSAQEQLCASLGREQELLCLLGKREILSLRATPHSSQIPLTIHATSAKPPRLSQDTAEIFPQTPAQLISSRHTPHCIPGNSDSAIEIPTGEAQGVNGAITPSSGNLETFNDNRVVSEVVEVGHSLDGLPELIADVGPIFPLKVSAVETSVLPVIPEVEPLTEISLHPGLCGCDVEVQDENSEEIREASRTVLEPSTQEQGDIHQPEKDSQSYETQPKPLEAIDHHMNHAVQSSPEMPAISGNRSSHERPASSGSRKRRRRTLVQDSSDEEYVASPPSKQKLFKPTVESMDRANKGNQLSVEMAGSNGTRKRRRRNLVQASSEEEDEKDYVASPPSKKKLFEASFDNLAASNLATPLRKNFQQYKSSDKRESPGRAAVVGMEFGGGITVAELVIEELEMDGKVTQPKHSLNRLKRKEKVELPKSGCAEQPLKVGLRRSKRLRLSFPVPTNDDHSEEDEIESSDDYTGSVESSEESSESPKLEKEFEETHGPSKPREKNKSDPNLIDLSCSDSDAGPPLPRNTVRSTRNKRTASDSESPYCSSSSSEQAVSPSDAHKVVNLLRPSPDDVEEDDSDDDRNSLDGFIVHESSSSDESVSNGEDQKFDSDSDEGDSGSQGTVREELIRKRENLIWDFEGDMLAAIHNNDRVALLAICALYRQQTKDEKHAKGAIYRNGRGFDKVNAQRGCSFAEFLVDGDESGQLKKSARALETRFFPGALQMCQEIASHHSKQLFGIYSNNEDPFWGKPTGQAKAT